MAKAKGWSAKSQSHPYGVGCEPPSRAENKLDLQIPSLWAAPPGPEDYSGVWVVLKPRAPSETEAGVAKHPS